MNKAAERLYNGIIKENPTFVLTLGMCPTLAVTTSAINGLGMGLTTAAVLALSNLMISAMRRIIPNRVRIPAFIVIIASFVTVVQLLLEAYLPFLNNALGVYIPLIVVNCIILGRAESYAYSNPPIPSLFDGLGMGLGFTAALTCIGACRELFGAGTIFGVSVLPFAMDCLDQICQFLKGGNFFLDEMIRELKRTGAVLSFLDGYLVPVGILVLAPGAFFVLAFLTALQNYVKDKAAAKGKNVEKIQSGCSEDCMNCGKEGCGRRFYDTTAKSESDVPEVVNLDEEEK